MVVNGPLKVLGTGSLDPMGKMMMTLMAYIRFYWELGPDSLNGVMGRTTGTTRPSFTLLDQGMGGGDACDDAEVFRVLHKAHFCGSKCGPVATAASECDTVLRIATEFTNLNQVLTMMMVPTDNYLNSARFPNMLRMMPSDIQASSADAVLYAWFQPKNYNLILCEGGIADQDRDIILDYVQKQGRLSEGEQVTVDVGRMKSKHLDLAAETVWFLSANVDPNSNSWKTDLKLQGLMSDMDSWKNFRSWLWGIRARCGRIEPNLMNLFLIAGSLAGIWTSGPVLLIDDTIFQGYYMPYMLGTSYATHYFSSFIWGSFAQKIKEPTNGIREKFFSWIDSSNKTAFGEYADKYITRQGQSVGSLTEAVNQKTKLLPNDFAWLQMETAWVGINSIADLIANGGDPTVLEEMKSAVNNSQAQSFSSQFKFSKEGGRKGLSYDVVQFHGVKEVAAGIINAVPALPENWFISTANPGRGSWNIVGTRTETSLNIDVSLLNFNQAGRAATLRDAGMDNPFCLSGYSKPFLQSPRELCVPCPPGYDLVEITANKCLKCEVGKYAEVLGTASCVGCQPGRYTTKIGASACDGCDKGFWTATPGRTKCDFCEKGSYADETGQSECNKCELGKFQTKTASTSCVGCPAKETTSGDGTVEPEDCVCNIDFFRPPEVGGVKQECETCPEGTLCRTINTTSNYPSGTDPSVWAAQHELYPYPRPAKNYWASYEEPHLIFRCSNIISCVGEKFGNENCYANKEEVTCAKCIDGFQRLNGDCLKCNDFEVSAGLKVMLLIMFIAFIAFLHWRSTDLPETWNQPYKALPQLGSLLLNFMQTIALTGQCHIGWQETPLTKAMELVGYALTPTDLLRFDCMGLGGSFERIFAFRVLAPIWVAVFFVITFLLFRAMYMVVGKSAPTSGPAGMLISGLKLERDVTITAYGGLFLSFYLTITSSSMTLFQTMAHPEPSEMKEPSVVLFPEIVVGTDRYMKMLGLAIPMFLLCCIAAPVLFTFLVVIAPKKFKSKDAGFLMRFKFLFVKLQPRTWWWSPIVCLKCLSYTFATVIFDAGFSQVMWIFIAVCIYFFFMCFQKPWRFDECNLFDIVVHLCVLGFVFVCQGLLFKLPDVSDVLILIDFSMYFPFIIAFFAVLSLVWQHLRPMPAHLRLQQAEEILAALRKIDENKEEWEKIFKGLTRQEQTAYAKTVEILQTEFGGPSDNKKAKRLKSSSGDYRPNVTETGIKELVKQQCEADDVQEIRKAAVKKPAPSPW